MKLRSRQILFFLALIAPVGKLVLMPAQIVSVSGNDLLFPVLAQLLMQAALVFCVLLLARREQSRRRSCSASCFWRGGNRPCIR